MEEEQITSIHLIIADDHELFRKGVISILKRIPFIKSIKEAANGKEVLDILSATPVDLILMDITMPRMDGEEATVIIRKKYPNVKIIALTMHDDERSIIDMFKAGVHGYVLKNTDRDELIRAIKLTLTGKGYHSSEVSDVLLPHMLNTSRKRDKALTLDGLTQREIEVLKLICQQYTSSEIAAELFLEKSTIERHRNNLLSKTKAKNSVGLLKYAQDNGIV